MISKQKKRMLNIIRCNKNVRMLKYVRQEDTNAMKDMMISLCA
jgi:hypothetical protein